MREDIQILCLLEGFPENRVTAAVREAVKRSLIGFYAVKHLLLACIERRPAHLDLSHYPRLNHSRQAKQCPLKLGRVNEVLRGFVAPHSLNWRAPAGSTPTLRRSTSTGAWASPDRDVQTPL